jgi:hypothetical protein
MTDDTTTPLAGSRVAVVDRRTARRLAIAERQRLDADAELERRGRAALQDLELAEARQAAEQRRRETRRRQAVGRRNTRRARRSARWAAAPTVAERALFVGPILFPMAVAWIGQIQYARTIMGWPLPGAVVFAAGFELSTVYVARLDWKARGQGDHGLVFRAATWMFAGLAASMNYWHAAGPGLSPNGEAVSYGAMSLAGVVLWELLSSYRHRSRLRAAGTLPPRRPRFGLARWVWFPRVTHLARLLALRDGHTLTESAWRAALEAAGWHGSVRAAIAELRGRHRIAPEGPQCDQTRAETVDETTGGAADETTGESAGESAERTVEATPVETSDRSGVATRDETAVETSLDDHVAAAAATAREPSSATVPAEFVETGAGWQRYHGNGYRRPQPADNHAAAAEDARRSRQRQKPGDRGAARGPAGIKTKMIRYVNRQRRAGRPVTGAELDRRFGTSNYGSRILRELDAQQRIPEE